MQLILALDTIRRYLGDADIFVGPIIILSYKNHALDEMLLDVLAADASLRRGTIRCGKSEDERLAQCGEKRTPAESHAEEVLATRVACVRAAQRTGRDLRALRHALAAQSDGETVAAAVVALQVESVAAAVRLRLRLERADGAPALSSIEAYAILESVTATHSDKAVLEERLALRGLASLDAGMEHWHGPPGRRESRAQFLLRNWLTGARPPPRCAASSEPGGCVLASAAEGAYCRAHRCAHPSGCASRRRDAEAPLCDRHRCVNAGCREMRLERSTVCAAHSCPRCVHDRCGPILPKLLAARPHLRPPEACAAHTCKAPLCVELAPKAALSFCERHSCKACFRFATTRPDAVATAERVDRSKFCAHHKCLDATCASFRIGLDRVGAGDGGTVSQDYCELHACVACDGRRQRVDPALPAARLCSLHRCAHTFHTRSPFLSVNIFSFSDRELCALIRSTH